MTTDPTSGSPNAPETSAPTPANEAPPSAGVQRGGQPRGRADFDASLEAEISAALGDMSVEDLLVDRPRAKPQGQAGRGGRQVRTGRVLRIHAGDVFVEFGPRSQGVCPIGQFTGEPPLVGTEMEFVVERMDAFEGLLVLSLPGAVQKADWGTLEIGQVVEARCTGMNKGGLEMEVAHHKGFMPAGMVDLRHIPDISVFIGEKFPCQIVELNKDKNRLILSRKAVLAAERASKRDELLAELEVGQVRPATIISIQPYGAFADLGGVDGLIHISDISHDRLKHPSEVLKEGEIVQVKIKKIDRDQQPVKISLSRKDTMNDPLAQAITAVNTGDTVTGKVTRITEFGAFVELAPGVEGLVHISEVSHERIPSVDKVLKRDEIVTCKVLQIDPGRKRISLSIKALQNAPERAGKPGEDRNAPRTEDPGMRKLKARLGGKSTQPQLKGGLG
jgi:small subunit ribosomal protein S1